MRRIYKILAFAFHFVVLFLGGILRSDAIKYSKTLMLINRIVTILYITYYLYNIINYGR